ncbi:hypothetical protein [Catellatospora sp. IY07-71]|nr:hypothetical protein [Catellatospora sp. IY07-71]
MKIMERERPGERSSCPRGPGDEQSAMDRRGVAADVDLISLLARSG